VVVRRRDDLRRVAVLGCSGAGKSTVAAELANRIGLPLVHLDELFWQPGWRMPDEESWRAVQRRLVAAPAWVLDGNYSSTYDERLPLADTVVVIEAPRVLCLVRVLRRTWRLRGTELAPGCPHRVDLGHLRYVWQFPRRHRTRLEAALAALGPETRVVRLRGSRQTRDFLTSL
jgi:adenylate kinase family enzyme